MTKDAKSMRSALARVRGLGSAKHGTEHWVGQRLTSLALIPLSIYVVSFFFSYVVFGDYQSAVIWLSEPFTAVTVILFVCVGFHHAANGLQVVIEDYVHNEPLKIASIVSIKFISVLLAMVGSVAVLKVLFFVIIEAMIQNARTPQH